MSTPDPTRRKHAADRIRPVTIRCGFLERHPASVLYSSGFTRVLCHASFEEGVPPFLEGRECGWLTAEYTLLPASTLPRRSRERGPGLSGRTQEIQRLIGRSLRAVVALDGLPGRTIRIDCDVLQADGGTRTASISGAWVAVALAVAAERRAGRLLGSPIRTGLAAVSAGLVHGEALLDLDQREDSGADVDLNVAMTGDGSVVEVQGTAEGVPFSRRSLDGLLDLAERGIAEIQDAQREALREAGVLDLVLRES